MILIEINALNSHVIISLHYLKLQFKLLNSPPVNSTEHNLVISEVHIILIP